MILQVKGCTCTLQALRAALVNYPHMMHYSTKIINDEGMSWTFVELVPKYSQCENDI